MAKIGPSAAADLVRFGARYGLSPNEVAELGNRDTPEELATLSGAREGGLRADILHTAEERAGGALATPRQVDYLVTLLDRRIQSGDGGGFMAFDHLISDDDINVDALRRISQEEASRLITSLRGDY